MMTPFIDIYQYLKACRKVTKYYQNNIRLVKKDFKKTNNLKILMLTPYPPYPLNTGAAIRRFETIKYLGLNNDLVVVSFTFSSKDYDFEDTLNKYCDLAIIIKTRFWVFPTTSDIPRPIRLFQSLRIQYILKKLQKFGFDIVIFDSIFTAQYQEWFLKSYTILFEHNIESQIIARSLDQEKVNFNKKLYYKKKKELKLFKEYEEKKWAKFPLKIVVSEYDKQELDSRCQSGETIVVNNGINTKTILPLPSIDAQKILFMGAMGYQPNIDAVNYFVTQILPLVWHEQPQLKFCIAGSHPNQSILELNNHPYIEVIANPEDMNQVGQTSFMTVVPMRIGGGTRIKILHSMAMGLPVISTTLGAEGLNVVDGIHILLRDKPTEFAQAILQISSDSDLRLKLRENGRLLVEKEYDWLKILQQMEIEINNFWGRSNKSAKNKDKIL
ncbi:glycosyltransferase family 4 protein [Crocosphaera sp. Alani8]|uniref:glycosyltransferase family 4 protein n=1 Tax=Crocosphaera sp. Alani8 TaxID=3038952 RepID=UPI00313D9345